MSAAPFPLEAPSSVTDPAKIIHNDWTAFSSLETLTDHWSRPAWPDGAQAMYWLLALGDFPDLRARAAQCQAALADVPDLDPVPVEWLHLTLCRVGPVERVAAEALSDIAAATAKRVEGRRPIRLSVGPLAGSAGAVRFTVSPWDQLLHLQEQLVAARDAVLGAGPNNGLRPHVSIAYNARRRAAAPVIKRVRELRDEPSTEIEVSNLDLVVLTRSGRTYKWRPAHRLDLVTPNPS
jgi:2'-5' RNA ligase